MTNKQRRQIIDGYIPPFKTREEGQEMSGTVHKIMDKIEYKFEIGAIIALLRKLLMATQDDNIAHRKHIGVLVEDVLNFLIDAMVESLKKEKQDDEK